MAVRPMVLEPMAMDSRPEVPQGNTAVVTLTWREAGWGIGAPVLITFTAVFSREKTKLHVGMVRCARLPEMTRNERAHLMHLLREQIMQQLGRDVARFGPDVLLEEGED